MLVRYLAAILVFCLPALGFSQQQEQTVLVVPNSTMPFGRNFLFSNPVSNTLILLYERRTETTQNLKVEVRRPLDLMVLKQASIPIDKNQQLRLADYRQSLNAVLAVVQDKTKGSLQSILILLNTQSVSRFSLSGSDNTVPVALAFNSSQQRWAMLSNEGVGSALTSIDLSGRQISRSVVGGAGGNLIDLAFDSCHSQFAAISPRSVRLIGGSARLINTPVELSFDSDQCQYRMARILNSVTPQILLLDSTLKTESTISLPGQIAEGLITDSRNEFNFSKARQSLFYPTVAGHSRLWINEVKGNEVRSRFVHTPVDSARLSMTVLRSKVYLLCSGLTDLKTTHRLALMKIPPP